MRHLGLFFSLPLLVFSSASLRAAELCVQSFNVYAPLYAPNKTARLTALGHTLSGERIPCDAIQFQEIWKEKWFELENSLLSSRRYAGASSDRNRADGYLSGISGFYQGSILSEESTLYNINNQDGFLDWLRGLVKVAKAYSFSSVKLDHAPSPIVFLNTHTHPANPAIRIAQMAQLAGALFDKLPLNRPLVFAADINATPDSIEYGMLTKVLLLGNAYLDVRGSYDGACTYCGNNPLSWSREDRVIDYVLFKNGGNMSLSPVGADINLKEAEGMTLSDHYGVRIRFAVSAKAPELLPSRSPEVLRRKTEALKVLESAYISLIQARESYLAPAIDEILKLRMRIQSAGDDSGLGLYYRTR